MQLSFNPPKEIDLLEKPKYYLALTALFRNEERFLKEWIEFYKLMGVEHFYLSNHLSNDNYMKVLEPYLAEGIIDLFDFTYEPKSQNEWYNLQNTVYLSVIRKIKDEVEWLIVVDTDEFLYPIQEQNLTSVLREYDNYASLSVNWRIFGSGKTQRIKDNELMIEELFMKELIPNLHLKTIVKPRYVENFNTHYGVMEPGYGQVTENKQIIDGSFSFKASTNILAINHYKYRDWNFFNSTKLSRVHMLDKDISAADKELKIQNLIDSNKNLSSIYNNDILKFVPALRLKMFGGGSIDSGLNAIDLLHNKKLYYLPKDLVFVVEDTKLDISHSLKNGYGFEPYMIKKIMAFSTFGEIYVGIGEGYGEFSLQMSVKLGDAGQVHAFEPNNNLFQYLSTNKFLNSLSNIKLYNELNDTLNLDSYFNNDAVGVIRINAVGHECEIIQGAEKIIDSSPDLRIFIKWQSGTGECLSSLLNKGFIFVDIKAFKEECSYLSYQVDYLLSIDEVLNSNGIEILAIKKDTFENYRKYSSNTPECTMLANKMMFNAALQGRDGEVEYCLSNGAEINYYDESISAPSLYYAASQNHLSTVGLLLSYGADIEFGYKKMVTPLFVAAEHGHYKIVEMLLEHGANRDFTFYGRSPAQVALDNDHIEVANLLLGEVVESCLDS